MKLNLRLAFMGTPAFAVLTLRALKDAGHDIAAVYTRAPKPAGRGQQTQKSAVHLAAEAMGLAVHTPKTLRDESEKKIFTDLKLDATVVVAYGLILPQAVLDAPRLGCINIHFSLLPRWRGAAPVQRAMLAGDTETGIDIMHMAAGLDTGDIVLREAVPITPTVTAPELLDDLAARGAPLTLKALEGLASGTLKPKPQPEQGVTTASRLTRDDGRIDWSKSAVEIERQLRALQPWPGCFFMMGDEPVKLLAAEIVPDKSGPPATLLDDQFTIACGQGALRLLKIQRPGKGPTDGDAFLRGSRLVIGHVF